jgi:hypothetical protein
MGSTADLHGRGRLQKQSGKHWLVVSEFMSLARKTRIQTHTNTHTYGTGEAEVAWAALQSCRRKALTIKFRQTLAGSM